MVFPGNHQDLENTPRWRAEIIPRFPETDKPVEV
jgi:hypothetical protein